MLACLASVVNAWRDSGSEEPNVAVLSVAFVVLAILAVLFGTLTAVIRDDTLEIRFGPGPIRKRFSLRDIESCQAVRNHWYWGWGIRLTPHGWLYNVSGLDAVEIRMKTGKKYRIGTDVPRKLERAILESLRTVGT